mmetsp:Transcript_47139/g.145847  ORF Transcript_47139/g.145847 Transcript_47139/m.145847 type:complete len:276 (-) Transcript_47139:70-897(-)
MTCRRFRSPWRPTSPLMRDLTPSRTLTTQGLQRLTTHREWRTDMSRSPRIPKTQGPWMSVSSPWLPMTREPQWATACLESRLNMAALSRIPLALGFRRLTLHPTRRSCLSWLRRSRSRCGVWVLWRRRQNRRRRRWRWSERRTGWNRWLLHWTVRPKMEGSRKGGRRGSCPRAGKSPGWSPGKSCGRPPTCAPGLPSGPCRSRSRLPRSVLRRCGALTTSCATRRHRHRARAAPSSRRSATSGWLSAARRAAWTCGRAGQRTRRGFPAGCPPALW